MSSTPQKRELLALRIESLTGNQLGAKRVGLLDRLFYFLMSLLVALVVVYGFSRTVNANLIHPPSPRPMVLYFHAVIFTGWVVFFIVQSVLIKARNLRVHRQLGWFGLALGAAMPVIGVATAIAMGRLRMREGHTDAVQFLIIPFFDMLAFTVAFGLGFFWRKKPEFHRRLILIATCSLTVAAFGRFPSRLVPHNWFYVGVDILILLGVVRDLVVTKRVHPVYVYGFPLLIFGQTVAVYTFVTGWPLWMRIAHVILG